MTQLIANLIFWTCLLVLAMVVYQSAILPGIRLSLRYRVFALRDQLRRLVIEGQIKESDPAFKLLHDRLNFTSTSLARFDLARVIQSASHMSEESRARVAAYSEVIESSSAEVQRIFKESLHVFTFAITFNSLFTFIISAVCLLTVIAVQSSFRHVRDLFWQKVDADAKFAFFSQELFTA